MCFGSTTTQQTNSAGSRVMPAWLTNQAQTNFANANAIAAQPYVRQQMSPLTSDQLAGFQTVRNAGGAANPYLSQIENAYGTYGSAPAMNINSPSILGGGVSPNNTSIQSYMDPNINAELAPTLANIERQRQIAVSGAGGVGSQATAQGGPDAFGDARAGVAEANTNEAALRANAAATGQAYQNAYASALQARGMDVGNAMNAQTANAGLNEQYLARVLGSGNALQNLDQSQLQRGLAAGNAMLGIGNQEQAFNQAVANLPYTNNQAQQQFALAGLQGQNAATATAVPAAGYTQYGQTSTQQPNNSGWALAGSLGGAILGNMVMPGVGGAIGSSLGGALAGGPYAPAAAGGSTNGNMFPSAGWLNNGFNWG
jgi:hypothetical protein